ncbi:MAG: DUF4440 domain-containing protein [bacterium]
MKLFTKIFVLSTLLISILFISCNNKQGKQTVDKNNNIPMNDLEVRKKIDGINNLLNKAVLAGDYETQLKYFTENAIVVPPIGPIAEGKSAIKDGYEKNIKMNVVFHSFNITTEDFWVCGDRVYERGKWAFSQSSIKSKNPKAFNGSYFQIWRAQKDSLFCIDYMIYTLDFNPFENN